MFVRLVSSFSVVATAVIVVLHVCKSNSNYSRGLLQSHDVISGFNSKASVRLFGMQPQKNAQNILGGFFDGE